MTPLDKGKFKLRHYRNRALVTSKAAPVVYFLKFQLDKLMSNQLLPRNVNPSSTETLAAGRCYNPRLPAAKNSRNSAMKKLLVICFALSLLFLMVAVFRPTTWASPRP